jgi:hypothetical protein
MFYNGFQYGQRLQRFKNWFDHPLQPWTLPLQTPMMQDNR